MTGSTHTAPGMLLSPKPDSVENLTWKWLGGLLLTAVMGLVVYFVVDLKDRVVRAETRLQAFEVRENNLQNSINNIEKRQESEHKLLVKIAGKLGIEVAE